MHGATALNFCFKIEVHDSDSSTGVHLPPPRKENIQLQQHFYFKDIRSASEE